MSDRVTYPRYQLDTFDQWSTVPLAAEQCGVNRRTLCQWLDDGRVPWLDWCGMRIVRLKDVRLAVASPPKRGRKAKGGAPFSTAK